MGTGVRLGKRQAPEEAPQIGEAVGRFIHRINYSGSGSSRRDISFDLGVDKQKKGCFQLVTGEQRSGE